MANTYDETLARLRRIETRLFRVCEHLGIDAPPGKKDVVIRPATDVSPPVAVIPGLDTSISAIKRALEAAGYPTRAITVDVATKTEMVGYLVLE